MEYWRFVRKSQDSLLMPRTSVNGEENAVPNKIDDSVVLDRFFWGKALRRCVKLPYRTQNQNSDSIFSDSVCFCCNKIQHFIDCDQASLSRLVDLISYKISQLGSSVPKWSKRSSLPAFEDHAGQILV